MGLGQVRPSPTCCLDHSSESCNITFSTFYCLRGVHIFTLLLLVVAIENMYKDKIGGVKGEVPKCVDVHVRMCKPFFVICEPAYIRTKIETGLSGF